MELRHLCRILVVAEELQLTLADKRLHYVPSQFRSGLGGCQLRLPTTNVCDLTRLQVQDIRHGSHVAARATVMQQKTQRPVQFEITEQTRESVEAWIESRGLKAADFLFPSRLHTSPHLSTRQYARIVHRWIASIGLDDTAYGTHTMRRTKASLIYRRTKNLRAVQLLLGHTKLESTVRYLGIEVDDALEMAEQTEV
ncbi:tyrosine-type recombinase/integrase [Achromobacter denitrificans]|uniref:tyrosine-type recombinase/integrase n=1 Tax=Achromobacter denitrificans TaxID=32002 RepID=UPI0035E3E98E